MFIKVLKTPGFAIVWKSILLSKDVLQKLYTRLIRNPAVGNGLFLHVRGWGIDHKERKKLQIPRSMARGGGHGNRSN